MSKSQLCYQSEELSRDFNLFGAKARDSYKNHVRGLVKYSSVLEIVRELRNMDSESYIEKVLGSLESSSRPSAVSIIKKLGTTRSEIHRGPFYSAILRIEVEMDIVDIGVVAQDRSVANGAWMPEHHLLANEQVNNFKNLGLPIVTFVDTPGAEANEQANTHNQAHSISRLIATMTSLEVPTVGIIYGLGYSGGAIPFTACNINLALRDAAFSTIQPKGLSSIARRLKLSWQKCAQIVGISSFELQELGIIDGIIDYSPSDSDQQIQKISLAIISSLSYLKKLCASQILRDYDLPNEYLLVAKRHCNPNEIATQFRKTFMKANEGSLMQSSDALFPNIFGMGYRHLRYLSLRQRLISIPKNQLGALRDIERANLQEHDNEIDVEGEFFRWAQNSGKIIYQNTTFVKSWKRFKESYESRSSAVGRLATLLFGNPQKRYERELEIIPKVYTSELYLSWKGLGGDLMHELLLRVIDPTLIKEFISADQLADPFSFAKSMLRGEAPLDVIGAQFTPKGLSQIKRIALYNKEQLVSSTDRVLLIDTIISECNYLLIHGYDKDSLLEQISPWLKVRSSKHAHRLAHVERMYDVIRIEELREPMLREATNLMLFDAFYDYLISQLSLIAETGLHKNLIQESTLEMMFEKGWAVSFKKYHSSISEEGVAKENFRIYCKGLSHKIGRRFLAQTQEWKRTLHPRISETLFVIITDILERLLPNWLEGKHKGISFNGTFKPQRIGKIKDFWNRLTIAYQDLLITDLLAKIKKSSPITARDIIKTYFVDFKEIMPDQVSGDPCSFPGFRAAIAKAIQNHTTPCGLVTGIGIYDDGKQKYKLGVVVSNPDFQAGAFDMASGEKFCQLLAECSDQEIPIVGFISSGGMQTKEGAGALYSMAVVNDKLNRFIEDFDLPVILFGFGDCTGGAQASFVTHPKVFNFYFSGTNMPFAGQIVVPSYLPYRATLSNYLSLIPGAMTGLVRHPFVSSIDEELRMIDSSIPLPTETVATVISRILKGDYSTQESVVAENRESLNEKILYKPIKKVLIHARGCTASKLIRIAQQLHIPIVLVQSDPDMNSSVAEQLQPNNGDTLIALGGNTSDESYLNGLSVIRVAEREGADALHPGIGFLSENPNFARLCRLHGINFIGPLVSSMETMGNKSNAVHTAMSNDVPVVPGSHGILQDANQGYTIAQEIGYPVLIKAVHGGGGKGIKVVERPDDFISTYQQVSLEAKSAFGNGELYLEKYVTSIRHIEAQILRDCFGNCKIVGIRDCSVQRDKQKVIEESDSTMLPASLRVIVVESATKLAHAVDYIGAGTVEFIFDLTNQAIYFMEMNTRLQVEHPVTEKVSGVDIVAQQFRIANGESIKDISVDNNGYSIEVRVTAEKIVKNAAGGFVFRADPGLVTHCEFPKDARIDVISAISSGKSISPFYDSLIAQIIIHESDRSRAISGMVNYLKSVSIKGVSTNIPLLLQILQDKIFQDGVYDTGYLPILLERVNTDELSDAMSKDGSASLRLDMSQIEIPESGELKVLAPGTGIFYNSPSPLDPPYLSEGDIFDANQTICLVEAMKVFSPLKLKDYLVQDKPIYDISAQYQVTRVNQQNGQQINTGDLLFVIKKTN
ncbi:MAG: biotin carboxylase N-terminal domain-containing protein [Methylacidiphilales bacterium]|nr:biotin carboxylase N-terminal domain-containing protein [Candidatus Methylacidiphilales bacterium]